jgi:transcriptional regulator of acetoin/glycerol metabolism
MRALLAHTWPGNVRELENALEYATAVCTRHVIFPEDLPPTVLQRLPERSQEHELQLLSEAVIREALEKHHWNRTAAARSLQVSRSTLWRRMRELRLTE